MYLSPSRGVVCFHPSDQSARLRDSWCCMLYIYGVYICIYLAGSRCRLLYYISCELLQGVMTFVSLYIYIYIRVLAWHCFPECVYIPIAICFRWSSTLPLCAAILLDERIALHFVCGGFLLYERKWDLWFAANLIFFSFYKMRSLYTGRGLVSFIVFYRTDVPGRSK